MDPIFAQYFQRYQQLRAMRDAGQIPPQQFLAELQRLRWQDGRGTWWTIDPEGKFLYYNGRQWLTAPTAPQPAPAAPAPAPTPAQPAAVSSPPAPVPSTPAPPSVQPTLAAMPQPTPKKEPELRPAAAPARAPAAQPAPARPGPGWMNSPTFKRYGPVIALAPSLVCGLGWFLYSAIGLFKSEGIAGVDCITPLIIVGLPLLILALKKPLDKLLLPVKPFITSFPKPLRLGVTIALPVLLSCGCSALTPSGYWALYVAAFVGVVTASLLLRY